MVSGVGSSTVKVSFRESFGSPSLSASMGERLLLCGPSGPLSIGGLVDVEDREAFFDDMSVAGVEFEPRVDVTEGWREMTPNEDGTLFEG